MSEGGVSPSKHTHTQTQTHPYHRPTCAQLKAAALLLLHRPGCWLTVRRGSSTFRETEQCLRLSRGYLPPAGKGNKRSCNWRGLSGKMSGLLLPFKDKRLCIHADLANVRSATVVSEPALPKGHVTTWSLCLTLSYQTHTFHQVNQVRHSWAGSRNMNKIIKLLFSHLFKYGGKGQGHFFNCLINLTCI